MLAAPACTIYAFSLWMDIGSTVRHGRGRVAASEASPLFRIISKRGGFAAAVPLQAACEAVLIAAVIPAVLADDILDPAAMAAAALAASAIHLCGWYCNSSSSRGARSRSARRGPSAP